MEADTHRGLLVETSLNAQSRRAGEIVNKTSNNNETQASSAGLGFSCVIAWLLCLEEYLMIIDV